MKIICLVVCCLVSLVAIAQKTQPKGGNGALQIVYYRIDFTQEDTDYLRTHAPELIFSVSETGKAKLEKVNDIDRASIIDSLISMNDQLPDFYPEVVNGKNEQGVYFMRLIWPNYLGGIQITTRYLRSDILIGGLVVNNNGWGTKFDFMMYGKKGWGGGFGTTFIIMKPNLTTIINGSFGKILERKHGDFAIQFEPGFGITGSTDLSSDRGVGLGFVPGISVAYLLPLGPGQVVRRYFLPVKYRHYINFHVAARQLIMNIKEASGTVYELGVSYRFSQTPVVPAN